MALGVVRPVGLAAVRVPITSSTAAAAAGWRIARVPLIRVADAASAAGAIGSPAPSFLRLVPQILVGRGAALGPPRPSGGGGGLRWGPSSSSRSGIICGAPSPRDSGAGAFLLHPSPSPRGRGGWSALGVRWDQRPTRAAANKRDDKAGSTREREREKDANRGQRETQHTTKATRR